MRSNIIAPMALFSALAVTSDYAMIAFPQVKLMDSIVFLAGYFYGLYAGLDVATITWLVYGTINPLGPAGFPLIVILITGEMIYGVAGASFRRMSQKNGNQSMDASLRPSGRNLTLGVIGASCALLYDLWTNAASGLIIYGSFQEAVRWIIVGIPFAIIHEVANFIFFSTLVPIMIVIIGKINSTRV